MGFSVNHHRFSASPAGTVFPPKRTPIVIDAEKQSRDSALKPATKPLRTERIIEAQPVKDDEQLLSRARVLPARSPMTAFAQTAAPPSRLGSSIDLYV